MPYSYTEKKRIRKDFGKLPEVLPIPDMLQVQRESYRDFLQVDVPAKKRKDRGIQAVLNAAFPIISHAGHIELRLPEVRPGRPALQRARMPAARADLHGAPAGQDADGDPREGHAQGRAAQGQGNQGTGRVPRRHSADDRAWHLRDQRHRTGGRVAAAAIAGGDLYRRQGAEPFLGQDSPPRPDQAGVRLLARVRVRPQGPAVPEGRQSPQDSGDDPSACDRHVGRGDPGDFHDALPGAHGAVARGAAAAA